jgi:23S rRNA pseudouridine1911/1915/1917 synthase
MLRFGGRMKVPWEERIIHEDVNCVVINKIPGEAMEGAAPGMGDLPALLGERYGGDGENSSLPTAVHRLDVPVSGCALFALNARSRSFLGGVFAEGAAERVYWAITEKPRLPLALKETGELIHWIRHDRGRNKSLAFTEPGPGRKRALLRYRLAGEGISYLFFEVSLVTGRHHQIRAQFGAAGLAVKGDLKYGARRSETGGGIRLHARSLCFPDPAGNGGVRESIRITAPPPFRDRLWEAFEECCGPKHSIIITTE